jgi:hypothetical protein
MSKEKIVWTLTEVKASDLKPNPNNPKIRDAKGFKRLQKSLSKFGKVYDGIANKDMSLIDGHSRLDLNTDDLVKVFIPSRQLDENEYKEMNAIFDIAKAGDTDQQMIEETFDDEFFDEWDIDKKIAKLKEASKNAKYPIVPEYDEQYDAIIIVCNSQTELTFIRNALALSKEISYKNKTVGETMVLTGKKFIEQWQSKSK